MLGIRFIKSQPTVHLMQFMKGRVVREGVGQSFFYYAPTSTVVAVPVESRGKPFMLTLISADFQSVTVQGTVNYRVKNPQLAASMLDFSLDATGTAYTCEDPQRLRGRVATQVEVIIQQIVQAMPLKEALRASAEIARHAETVLSQQPGITALGLEVLGVSIQAVKPTPDTACALEAEARAVNMKSGDDIVVMLGQERRPLSAVEWAEPRLPDRQVLRAANDFFIDPRSHPSALYDIQYRNQTERQSSSGLIVATGLGSTAWMKSVVTGSLGIAQALGGGAGAQGYRPTTWDADHLLFAVREPFGSRQSDTQWVYEQIDVNEPLLLRARMPEGGIIFSDGMEADHLNFTAGMEARIGVCSQRGGLVQ
jgi:hypothetical protein